MKPYIPYYTLVAKTNGQWHVVYGAYTKITVKERQEALRPEYSLGTTRIITTSDQQEAINAAVLKLIEAL